MLEIKEKNLMWWLLFEGLFAFVLGCLMFILPAYTSVTFALLASIGLLAFGVYKFFQTIFIRKYIEHVWLNLLFYLIVTFFAAILFLNPELNMLVITFYIAAYLLFLGTSSITFAFQTRSIMKFWWVNIIVALLEIIAS